MTTKSVHLARRAIQNVKHMIARQPAILFTNILLTKFCTQRCLQCSIPLQATKSDVISVENFKRLVDRLDAYGTQVITLSGGEPMLHPQLEECVEYAVSKRFARVHLLTTLFGPEKLVEKTIGLVLKTGISLSVSFDGFGEVADRLRGVKDVERKVSRNIEIFRRENTKLRKPVQTGANIVINRLNLHQVPALLDYLEDLGWSTDVDIYRWASTNQRESEILKITDTPEFRKVLSRVKASPVVFTPDWLIDGFPDYLNGKTPKLCPYLDAPSTGSKFFIDPDGMVKVCIGDPVGNILEQTPEEIFSSSAWKAKLEEFRRCPSCWNTCYTTSAKLFQMQNFKDIIKALKVVKKQSKNDKRRETIS